jgi:Phosphorylated CTD interacting factor 1 WW domain
MSENNDNIKDKIIDEYVNFIGITQKIKNIHFIKNKKLASKLFDQLFQFIIEDRILYRFNTIKKPPYHGYNEIVDKEEFEIIDNHFNEKKQYMKKKNKIDEVYIKLEQIKKYFIYLVNNKHKIYKDMYTDKNNNIIVIDNYVKYQKIKIQLDHRLRFLLEKAGKEHFLQMILRYVGYGITGQHCSIPTNTYQYLYDAFGIRGEGFASPLNSKLISMDNTAFCSLFEDTDKHFGSLGPFFSDALVNNPNKNWLLNPPYMPNIMMMTYNEIMKAFEKIKRKDFLVIIILPKWEEDEAYIKFKTSKYLVKLLEPEEGEHYMNCNGRVIYMYGMTNSMFFLCRDRSMITDDKIDKLLEVWNTYAEDKLNQSFFVLPEIL